MPDITCPNCHATVAAGRFCSNCAGPLAIVPQSSARSNTVSTIKLILALLIFAGVFLVGAIFTNFYGLGSIKSSSSTDTTPQSGITLANYNRIQDGMSYSQVIEILGKAGQEISSTNIAGFKTVWCISGTMAHLAIWMWHSRMAN